MGWHFILDFSCRLLPEYVEFVKENYFEVEPYSDKYDSLPRPYREFIDIWSCLDLDGYLQNATLNEEKGGAIIYSSSMCKKVTSHLGDLWEDYEIFMKQIIVPMSSVVLSCTIESDDYGDRTVAYTDGQLRGWKFNVGELIKKVEHEWEDGRVVASRVVYKRSVPPEHVADLARFYR